MRLTYKGHKPGLWALYSSKGLRKVSLQGRKVDQRAINGWFRNPPFVLSVLTLRHVLGWHHTLQTVFLTMCQ
jgi:hypothetical protein